MLEYLGCNFVENSLIIDTSGRLLFVSFFSVILITS